MPLSPFPKRPKLDNMTTTDEQQELESLERISWRLVQSKDDLLGDILAKLLPIMITKLDTDSRLKVKQKVLEILAHVNVRLKGALDVKISPVRVWEAYSAASNPVAKNIGLVYVQKAFERCPEAERAGLVNMVVPNIRNKPREHQMALLLHAFASLRGLSPAMCHRSVDVLNTLADLDTLEKREDARLFLGVAEKLLMYVPGRDGATVSATAGGTAPRVMAGLSATDVQAMTKIPLLRYETVDQVQLGVLEYVHAASMDPNMLLVLYLAAAASPFATVSKRGEVLLAKTCVLDTSRPTVNIEDHGALKTLFNTYLGNMEDETLPEESRRQPASRSLQSRIISVLCRSTIACNMNPEASMLIHDAIFGESAGVSSQQQGMQFAVHVLRHADTLKYLAPAVIQHSLRILETSQGNDTLNSLRGFAYQSLGQLAQRDPATLEEHKLKLTKQCFEALKIEPPGVRASVQEAVNCLSNCFWCDCNSTAADVNSLTMGTTISCLRDFLTQCTKSDNSAVRQAALHWWIWVFPFSDCMARFHCILLSSDSNVNISNLAREGLDDKKVAAFQRSKSIGAHHASTDGQQTQKTPKIPRIADMIETIVDERPSLVGDKRSVRPITELAMPAPSMEVMIQFLGGLSTHEPRDVLSNQGTISKYFAVLSAAIVPHAPGSLHGIALESMLQLAARFNEAFLNHFVSHPQCFESMLQHIDETVSCKAARLLGFLGRAMDPRAVEQLIDRLHNMMKGCIDKIIIDGKAVKQERCLGAIYASGFLAAWMQRDPSPSSKIYVLVDDLMKLSTASHTADSDVLRSVALVALGYSTLGRPLHADGCPNAEFGTDTCCEDPIKSLLSDDGAVKQLKRSPHKEVPIHVAVALGLIGMTESDEARKEAIVNEILENHTSKSENLLEACGMALVFVWGGSDFDDQRHLLTKVIDNGEIVDNSGSVGEVCTTINAKPSTPTIRNNVLKFIVNKCISSTRAEARLAGAMWLLSLTEHVAETKEISDAISDIQKAFCILLGDSNDRIQELASRGVTTAYQHARDDSKSQLVDSLVEILSGSGGGGTGSNPKRWMRPNDVEGDTQIFEPGTLGSLPDQGGNISTYKEICSLATDLGQPDLIYQFMNLAAHQAAADASRGAAYGMASVAAIAGDELKEHVQALIPRLYRSTFDPNPLVRDSMRHIWVALVDDQREALKKHLAAILSLLSKDMTRQQWRIRESAALAMADVLQGLAWVDIRDAFEGIMKSCFRVIDDVKESVAVAGQALARAISSLALRLADAQNTKSGDSADFLGAIFPLLTGLGIGSDVPIIRAFSVDMIAKLTKSAGKEAVQDSMQTIVPPMLEALSGMEDARLNYLEQHVERLGVDANRFEEERIRFAQSSPIADTLDLCSKNITGTTFCDLSTTLVSFIRKAVGTATKSGTATFIIASVRRLGSAVKPVSLSMMKALYEASSLEKSASVRKSYASAYANLSKYAPRSKVGITIETWLSTCKQEDVDLDYVLLTGTMLKAISSEASDVFLRYADDVAPLAFLLQYEECSSDIVEYSDGNNDKMKPKPTQGAIMWAAVWEEVTTATGSGVRGHVGSISTCLLDALSSSHWVRKKAAGRGLVVLGETAGDILGEEKNKVVDGLLRALAGRLWDGKEVLLESLAVIVINCKLDAERISQAVDALLTACQKKTVSYKIVAFAQLGRVAKYVGRAEDEEHGAACGDLYQRAWPVFDGILRGVMASGDTANVKAAKKSSTNDTHTSNITQISVIVDCLAAFWMGSNGATRDVAVASSTIDVLLPVLREHCDRVGDQRATLEALWEIIGKIKDLEKIGEERIVLLAESLMATMVSSKTEHNRLLASDVLLKVLEYENLPEKTPVMLSPSISTLRAHRDKSAAVRARIEAVMQKFSGTG